MAHRGRPEEDYARLLGGCRRAQEDCTGRPWEGALLERWRGALKRVPTGTHEVGGWVDG